MSHNQCFSFELPTDEDKQIFISLIKGLSKCPLAYAISADPYIHSIWVDKFWHRAQKRINHDGNPCVWSKIGGQEIEVYEADIRRILKIGDNPAFHVIKFKKDMEAPFYKKLGYDSEKFGSLEKKYLPPYWKFLIHVITHCLSDLKGGFDSLRLEWAGFIKCLIDETPFNYSRMILNSMLAMAASPTEKKWPLYSRFVQLILDDKIPDVPRPVYPTEDKEGNPIEVKEPYRVPQLRDSVYQWMTAPPTAKTHKYSGTKPWFKFGRFTETETVPVTALGTVNVSEVVSSETVPAVNVSQAESSATESDDALLRTRKRKSKDKDGSSTVLSSPDKTQRKKTKLKIITRKGTVASTSPTPTTAQPSSPHVATPSTMQATIAELEKSQVQIPKPTIPLPNLLDSPSSSPSQPTSPFTVLTDSPSQVSIAPLISTQLTVSLPQNISLTESFTEPIPNPMPLSSAPINPSLAEFIASLPTLTSSPPVKTTTSQPPQTVIPISSLTNPLDTTLPVQAMSKQTSPLPKFKKPKLAAKPPSSASVILKPHPLTVGASVSHFTFIDPVLPRLLALEEANRLRNERQEKMMDALIGQKSRIGELEKNQLTDLARIKELEREKEVDKSEIASLKTVVDTLKSQMSEQQIAKANLELKANEDAISKLVVANLSQLHTNTVVNDRFNQLTEFNRRVDDTLKVFNIVANTCNSSSAGAGPSSSQPEQQPGQQAEKTNTSNVVSQVIDGTNTENVVPKDVQNDEESDDDEDEDKDDDEDSDDDDGNNDDDDSDDSGDGDIGNQDGNSSGNMEGNTEGGIYAGFEHLEDLSTNKEVEVN